MVGLLVQKSGSRVHFFYPCEARYALAHADDRQVPLAEFSRNAALGASK